ncbi:MAG: hypothetical protein EPN55_09700 [Gammaproteobacteria bacterium]|nr:MAG: hypothetical protein EPN55_09700 [Gammaproteobacteria bacterium]
MVHLILIILSVLLPINAAYASDPRSQYGRQQIEKYAGTYFTNELLSEPLIEAETKRLLGGEYGHLKKNISARAPIGLVGDALSISGNAPHMGGKEMAIVCIQTYKLKVHAAIYSMGKITIFTDAQQYGHLPLCIQDWITVVNSGLVDRFKAPKNVQITSPK